MIRIQIVKNLRDLDSIRTLWDQLAHRPDATVFQRFTWNRLAAELFADREEPHIVVASRDYHAVILPLVIRTNGALGLIGEALFDYRDMLSTGDSELEFAALAEAASLKLPLEVTALTPDAARRWGSLPQLSFVGAPRIVHDKCSPDDLRAAHRRLGRHSRRLLAHGVQLKHRDATDIEFIREIYARKAKQSGSLFVDPLRREFMERLCFEEGNRCRVYSYETSADLVAALVTFQGADTRHFYTVYFDTEWQAFSPGQVLLFDASLGTLDENLHCDYLTGEQPYKMRLANDSVPLVRLELSAEQLRDALGRRLPKTAA